jgi:Tol biopolymer transport system component
MIKKASSSHRSKRNPKYMDLYEMDIDSFKSKLIFKNDDALNIGDISKNKRYLALSKTYTRDNSDLYIYNFDNQNLKKVLFEETDVNHSPARFSLDSKTIYYVTDLDSEFRYLKKYNIETGKVELVQKKIGI